MSFLFFFQAEDGIRDLYVTGVQTCALPISRWGEIDKVLEGIEAARAAGLAVKINAVALKNLNEDELPGLMRWAHGKGLGLTLIEVMPMGEIGSGRIDQYLPLSLVRARLAQQFTLTDLAESTGG